MKAAKIIFISACAFLCIWPIVRVASINSEFEQKGELASFVQARKAPFFDTVFVSGPVVEKTGRVGFADRIRTAAGMHLIHDPSLADEYILSGPQSALDHIILGNPFDLLNFRFDRPMVMDEPVELRVNLNAHHPGIITLDFNEHGGSKAIPRFTTLGPIEARVVAIYGCTETDGPIQLKTDFLAQGYNCPDVNYAGDIGRVETHLAESDNDYTNVAVGTVNISEDWPGGRSASFVTDSLHIWYDFDRQSAENVVRLINPTPDTLYLPAEAKLHVEWRYGDEELIGMDTALVVRRDL